MYWLLHWSLDLRWVLPVHGLQWSATCASAVCCAHCASNASLHSIWQKITAEGFCPFPASFPKRKRGWFFYGLLNLLTLLSTSKAGRRTLSCRCIHPSSVIIASVIFFCKSEKFSCDLLYLQANQLPKVIPAAKVLNKSCTKIISNIRSSAVIHPITKVPVSYTHLTLPTILLV